MKNTLSKNNRYLLSLIVTSMITIFTVFIINLLTMYNIKIEGFMFYLVEYSVPIISSVSFLISFNFYKDQISFKELFISARLNYFIIYSYIVYIVSFLLEDLLDTTFILAKFGSVTDYTFYKYSLISQFKTMFDNYLTFSDRLNIAKFMIWNIMILIYVLYYYFKKHTPSKKI